MNAIEALQSHLRRAYPQVELDLSQPKREDGVWQLQLTMPKPDSRIMFVDWQEDGFGFDAQPDPLDISFTRLSGFPLCLSEVIAAVRIAIEN